MQSDSISWWQDIDRAAFAAEIAERFKVNKADPPRRYGPVNDLNKERSSRGGRASNLRGATATSCAKGHAWTPENTVIRGDGQRLCRICKRINQKRYKAKVAARREVA